MAVSEAKYLQAEEKDVKSLLRSLSMALKETNGNDVIVDANWLRNRTDREVIIS